MQDKKHKRLCIVITASLVLQSLYREQFKFLIENGFEITVVSPAGKEHELIRRQGVKVKAIPMRRTPHLFLDFLSLLRLWYFFLFNRFDLVSVSTPKASLLGALAARLAFQNNVVYMVRGRAYENFTGFKRKLYEILDRLVCSISISVQSISHELANIYISKKICAANKMRVLGEGSSNGVDLSLFSSEKFSKELKLNIRGSLGIPEEAFVFLYCGRLCKDKGTEELVDAFEAFKSISKARNTLLLIVGRYEKIGEVSEETKTKIDLASDILHFDWSLSVQNYMAIADIFVFPSYREGFGNVAIEASAMKLPVIAFDVIGCRESVKDGVSGILCPPFSSQSLARAMEKLYKDSVLREYLSNNGYSRVINCFSNKVVWTNLLNYYNSLCASKGKGGV